MKKKYWDNEQVCPWFVWVQRSIQIDLNFLHDTVCYVSHRLECIWYWKRKPFDRKYSGRNNGTFERQCDTRSNENCHQVGQMKEFFHSRTILSYDRRNISAKCLHSLPISSIVHMDENSHHPTIVDWQNVTLNSAFHSFSHSNQSKLFPNQSSSSSSISIVASIEQSVRDLFLAAYLPHHPSLNL